jgi:DNA-directed RNA polymerase specialized sigma24 family protein
MTSTKTILSNTKYSKNCREFLHACSQLFHYDKNSSDALYKYVILQIKLWNLHNVDASDVLTEAVIRGVHLITQKSEPIDNPRAWLRVAATNILKEEARAISRVYQLNDIDLDRYEYSFSQIEERPDWLENSSTKALKAFQSLSKSDKRIIAYRLIGKMRYCEIQRLSAYENVDVHALRKQYSRAIKRLKDAFFEIQVTSSSTTSSQTELLMIRQPSN